MLWTILDDSGRYWTIAKNKTILKWLDDYSKILEFVDENGIISREEASKIIGKGRSTTANVMSKLVENNVLRKINEGPNTRYIR